MIRYLLSISCLLCVLSCQQGKDISEAEKTKLNLASSGTNAPSNSHCSPPNDKVTVDFGSDYQTFWGDIGTLEKKSYLLASQDGCSVFVALRKSDGTSHGINIEIQKIFKDGVRDLTFGSNGILKFPGTAGLRNILIKDQYLYFFMRSSSENSFYFTRYSLDGILDQTFGNAGRIAFESFDGMPTGSNVVLQSSGTYLYFYWEKQPTAYYIRYGWDLKIDRNFNNGQAQRFPVYSAYKSFYNSMIRPTEDGGLIVSGHSGTSPEIYLISPNGGWATTYRHADIEVDRDQHFLDTFTMPDKTVVGIVGSHFPFVDSNKLKLGFVHLDANFNVMETVRPIGIKSDCNIVTDITYTDPSAIYVLHPTMEHPASSWNCASGTYSLLRMNYLNFDYGFKAIDLGALSAPLATSLIGEDTFAVLDETNTKPNEAHHNRNVYQEKLTFIKVK